MVTGGSVAAIVGITIDDVVAGKVKQNEKIDDLKASATQLLVVVVVVAGKDKMSRKRMKKSFCLVLTIDWRTGWRAHAVAGYPRDANHVAVAAGRAWKTWRRVLT